MRGNGEASATGTKEEIMREINKETVRPAFAEHKREEMHRWEQEMASEQKRQCTRLFLAVDAAPEMESLEKIAGCFQKAKGRVSACKLPERAQRTLYKELEDIESATLIRALQQGDGGEQAIRRAEVFVDKNQEKISDGVKLQWLCLSCRAPGLSRWLDYKISEKVFIDLHSQLQGSIFCDRAGGVLYRRTYKHLLDAFLRAYNYGDYSVLSLIGQCYALLFGDDPEGVFDGGVSEFLGSDVVQHALFYFPDDVFLLPHLLGAMSKSIEGAGEWVVSFFGHVRTASAEYFCDEDVFHEQVEDGRVTVTAKRQTEVVVGGCWTVGLKPGDSGVLVEEGSRKLVMWRVPFSFWKLIFLRLGSDSDVGFFVSFLRDVFSSESRMGELFFHLATSTLQPELGGGSAVEVFLGLIERHIEDGEVVLQLMELVGCCQSIHAIPSPDEVGLFGILRAGSDREGRIFQQIRRHILYREESTVEIYTRFLSALVRLGRNTIDDISLDEHLDLLGTAVEMDPGRLASVLGFIIGTHACLSPESVLVFSERCFTGRGCFDLWRGVFERFRAAGRVCFTKRNSTELISRKGEVKEILGMVGVAAAGVPDIDGRLRLYLLGQLEDGAEETLEERTELARVLVGGLGSGIRKTARKVLKDGLFFLAGTKNKNVFEKTTQLCLAIVERWNETPYRKEEEGLFGDAVVSSVDCCSESSFVSVLSVVCSVLCIEVQKKAAPEWVERVFSKIEGRDISAFQTENIQQCIQLRCSFCELICLSTCSVSSFCGGDFLERMFSATEERTAETLNAIFRAATLVAQRETLSLDSICGQVRKAQERGIVFTYEALPCAFHFFFYSQSCRQRIISVPVAETTCTTINALLSIFEKHIEFPRQGLSPCL
ncbi:MAG: uncharacterized protein A8A55_0925 [Amphiamblys sp. WSBS2006]|nr:MAG: uncharacterized protein A8A55_0925 [Amphiamblys sp. WSBS2006]